MLVLAQVRFSPVQAMEKYVPEIQDRLRKSYPRYQERRIQSIHFGPKPVVTDEPLWLFTNKPESASVTLSKNFVTLSTHPYKGFEHFLNDLEQMLEVVGEIVRLDLVERLGLRYVNLIRLDRGEEFNDYFRPNLLGLSHNDVNATEALNRFEFDGRTPVGRLVIRISESADGTILPADLKDSALKYTDQIKPGHGEKARFLDIDHFSDTSADWDVPKILATYTKLHTNCEMAFKQSVTPVAMDKWRGQGQ